MATMPKAPEYATAALVKSWRKYVTDKLEKAAPCRHLAL